MPKPKSETKQYGDTIKVTCVHSGGDAGYWLYDTTRNMNLALRCGSEVSALVDAIQYYQQRLSKVENDLRILQANVENFVSGVYNYETSEFKW